MVAGIAPEPVTINVAVAEYRARSGYSDTRQILPSEQSPLPPVPAPVPTPVPAPALVPPTLAFAAALVAEQLPTRAPTLGEMRLRLAGNWQAPQSQLRLADRRV